MQHNEMVENIRAGIEIGISLHKQGINSIGCNQKDRCAVATLTNAVIQATLDVLGEKKQGDR